MQTVIVTDGLRIHQCPKVASTSLTKATKGMKRRMESPADAGPEYRWMVVRHPLDRLVSAYCFFCLGAPRAIAKMGICKGMPFDDFLHTALNNPYGDQHLVPQFMYAGQHKFDRLCRIENLYEEWAELRKMFPYLRPISSHNKSHHKPWQEFYTPAQRERAEKVYAADMALYEASDPNPPKEKDDAEE